MLAIEGFLRLAVSKEASDVFIISGLPISMKKDSRIIPLHEQVILPEMAERLVHELFTLAGRTMDKYMETGDDDFSASISGLSRFRINAYKQKGSLAAIIRVVHLEIPDYQSLNIPEAVMEITKYRQGLVLLTGPSGSGKTTTLACMIDRINRTRNAHIITLEDPIEYLHQNKRSIVSQREIGIDSQSYLTALRASLRQAPNVILLGEMRDTETIRIAMTAAETGHLVISTLHTVGAVNSIDRIIDSFPGVQQQQIRIQLAMILKSVVSQQLVPKRDGTLIPAFEIMHATNSVRTLIRESKIHQLGVVIETSSNEGMIRMDRFLQSLLQQGQITEETAMAYTRQAEYMGRNV